MYIMFWMLFTTDMFGSKWITADIILSGPRPDGSHQQHTCAKIQIWHQATLKACRISSSSTFFLISSLFVLDLDLDIMRKNSWKSTVPFPMEQKRLQIDLSQRPTAIQSWNVLAIFKPNFLGSLPFFLRNTDYMKTLETIIKKQREEEAFKSRC